MKSWRGVAAIRFGRVRKSLVGVISRIAPAGIPGNVSALAMQSSVLSSRRGDGHLWVIAFGLSLLANTAILATVGFAALESARMRQKTQALPAPPAASVVMIFPEVPPSQPTTSVQEPAPATATPTSEAAAAAAAAVTVAGPRFARTSEDQPAARPEHPAFIGERDTQATSDRAPVANAPAMPSQAGVAPRSPTDIETTVSRYQDGSLESHQSAPLDATQAPSPTMPEPSAPQEPSPATAANSLDDPASAEPPAATGPLAPREPLLAGPNPVDVEVPREDTKSHSLQPKPENLQAADTPPQPSPSTKPNQAAESPKPTPPRSPEFKGAQRKTAIIGSITRAGRSALDVEDSPLGRYQARLSRAVELEWQRNCMRHRDFIKPGFLTVRFFVEAGGKVRSVQFVDEMATGEVQKGFTLNSIRDAAIPPMPSALRKQYDQEPLELIFRFYF